MDRRTFLTTSCAVAASLAGCLGGQSNDSTSDVQTGGDGYPATTTAETTQEAREIDPSSFETITTNGTEVPLVPVDVAHYWYQRREARFADARGAGQYERSHIKGAVLSSANGTGDDPAADWPTDNRIITYCGCPHHLSSIRAATFISNGYEEVYAIDEGFFEWRDRGYPVTGEDATQKAKVIRGRAEASAAGEYAWASHEASDQQEATPIDSDGSYRLELHFGDLGPSAPIQLRTPSYELTAPLSQLTADVVTGSL